MKSKLKRYSKKRMIFFIFSIFTLGMIFLSNTRNAFSVDCCYYISVSTEITTGCCVEISVRNPQCYDGNPPYPLIRFMEYNSSTRTYEQQHSATCPTGGTISYTLCPLNGETVVNYRVLIDNPACGTPMQPYIEGQTQFTGSVDLSSCCDCPENRNDWLSIDVHKSPTCPNKGCEVIMDLNIPDSITCFKYYIFEDMNGNDTPPMSISDDPISNLRYCVNGGQSGTIYVDLLETADQDIYTGCIIEKEVSCDTTGSDTIPNPCTPDTCDEPWNEARWQDVPLDNEIDGCVIHVLYTYRIACSEEYQDLQILAITYDHSKCNYTYEEIFQKAVEGLISMDPMGFEPSPVAIGCSDVWRITIVSCWKFLPDTGPGGQQYTMWPCDSGCCSQQLRVCRDAQNKCTVTPIGSTNIFNGNCDTLGAALSFWKCYTICSWIYISGEIQPMGEAFKSNNNQNDMLSPNINYSGNYNEGILDFSMKTGCGEVLKVEITDVYGTKLISYEQLSKTKDVNFKIDAHSLEHGYYVYKIFCNGNFMGNGKFFVK